MKLQVPFSDSWSEEDNQFVILWSSKLKTCNFQPSSLLLIFYIFFFLQASNFSYLFATISFINTAVMAALKKKNLCKHSLFWDMFVLVLYPRVLRITLGSMFRNHSWWAWRTTWGDGDQTYGQPCARKASNLLLLYLSNNKYSHFKNSPWRNETFEGNLTSIRASICLAHDNPGPPALHVVPWATIRCDPWAQSQDWRASTARQGRLRER